MGQVARGADWFVLCVYISPRRRYGEVPIGDPGAVTSALLLVATLVLLASAQIIVLPREPHIPIVRSGRSAVWQWRGKQIFKSAGSLADPHHRQRRRCGVGI